MELSESVETIFELRHHLEQTFFKSFFHKKIATKEMSYTQIITLIILKFNGPSPMSFVSEKLTMEKGSFTPVANCLITKGYIEKRQVEYDKRVYELSLTDKGLAYAKDYTEEHRLYIKQLFEVFSEKEQDEFFKAVKYVVDAITRIE